MRNEPNKAQKKEPPTIAPAPKQGPAYDPMDRIVQDVQNIQSFLAHIEENPEDLEYLDSHLSKTLKLRRTILHQIDMIKEDPYFFSEEKLRALKKSIEAIFSYLEGAVGALNPLKPEEFNRFIQICEKALLDFDGKLTL